MNDKPLWSRCSLGRNRWYWIVWRCFEDVCNDTDPIATGYAASANECEAAALAVEPGAANVQAGWASSHHRKTCVQRRMRKPASDSKQTVQQEYLYTNHDKGDWWDGTGDWLYSQAHRIVKVTKQSVFVEKEYWRSQIGVETYRLDRRELEENGETWSHQARERFFTKPIEERRQQCRPQYLVDLDLPAGATKGQIKSQFRRLAMKHHPDRFGDAEEFKRVKRAYDKAMAKAAE